MKKWILPDKKVNKENLQYEWVAENDACDVCKSLNGKIYNSAEDIPDRPHPNCKCHIEIIENFSNDEIKDPIEKRRKKKEDRQRILLELKELNGNIKVNKDEVNELLKKVRETKEKYTDFQNFIGNDALTPKDKKELDAAIHNVNEAINKTQKVKNDLDRLEESTVILEGRVEKTDIWSTAGTVIFTTLNTLKQTYFIISKALKEIIYESWVIFAKNDIITNTLVKITANAYGTWHTNHYNMPEALNLYKVSSPEYNYNKDYVNKNGYLYKSISDLKDYKLEKEIHQRINKEMRLKDCKVLFLRNDSSISKTIEKSEALKKFVKENINDILNNKPIPEKEVTFKSIDSDMYSALHGSVFKDAHLDKDENLIIRVEDFWNFEKRWTSAKAIVGRYLQDTGRLIPYYVVIQLKINKNIWKTFI